MTETEHVRSRHVIISRGQEQDRRDIWQANASSQDQEVILNDRQEEIAPGDCVQELVPKTYSVNGVCTCGSLFTVNGVNWMIKYLCSLP